MIDLHCHLLPNIDDGPKSWEESLDMVSIASQDGIKGAVTTPHWIQGSDWQPSPSTVREKVDELNTRISDKGLDFKVYPGMEVAITSNLDDLVNIGEILTLAQGEYLLLEIPFYSLPYGMEDIIYNLAKIGKTVVLAHPERSKDFQEEPESIIRFKELGALVQVTASSFYGDFGENAKKCVHEFAAIEAIDIVASDAHSNRRRKPIISKGLSVMEDEFGSDIVSTVIKNSYQVIGAENPV